MSEQAMKGQKWYQQYQPDSALVSPEAELTVLGGFVTDAGTLPYLQQLSSRDFYHEDTARLFGLLQRMAAQKQPIDLVTIDAAGGDFELAADCARRFVSAGLMQADIEVLQQARRRRELDIACREIGRMVCDRNVTVDEAADQLRGRLRSMEGEGPAMGRTLSDALIETLEEVEQRAAGKLQGMKTGLADFDRVAGGLFGGELSIVGARPSVGKSALAMYMAHNVARNGHKVLFVSREMTDKQLCMRLLSRQGRVSTEAMRTGKITAEQLTKVAGALGPLSALDLEFDEGSRSVGQIAAAVARKMGRGGVDLLVVDYLQLLEGSKKTDSRVLEVGQISRGLKAIAKDNDIPVIAAAQINRASQGRRPTMADLRESGDIEQDADNIYLLHAPEPEEVEAGRRGYAEACTQRGNAYMELIIDKARQGVTGRIDMEFNKRFMEFTCFYR